MPSQRVDYARSFIQLDSTILLPDWRDERAISFAGCLKVITERAGSKPFVDYSNNEALLLEPM